MPCCLFITSPTASPPPMAPVFVHHNSHTIQPLNKVIRFLSTAGLSTRQIKGPLIRLPLRAPNESGLHSASDQNHHHASHLINPPVPTTAEKSRASNEC